MATGCGDDGGSEMQTGTDASSPSPVDASSVDSATPQSQCADTQDCTPCEYVLAPASTAECYCLGCSWEPLSTSECADNLETYNALCNAETWPDFASCPIFDCPSVEADCNGDGACFLSECGAEAPGAIDATPAGLANEIWGPGPLVIDLEACEPALYSKALPLGSAFVAVEPSGDRCNVWLGGETEDPTYDGSPTQQCRYVRSRTCELRINVGQGGPATTDGPGCTVAP